MKMPRTLLPLFVAAVLAGCAHVPQTASEPSVNKGQDMPYTQSVVSKYSFDETVSRLEHAVKAKGMTVFAVIDHQAAAKQSGLSMQPAKVIVFGTPKAGTPLMVKDPEFALQLPLKVLVTETGGEVKAVFNDTRQLNRIWGSGEHAGQCRNADSQNRRRMMLAKRKTAARLGRLKRREMI